MNVTGDKAYDRVLTVALTLTSLLLANSSKFSHAQYGKFGGKKSAGVSLDPRVGWFLMEIPAPVSFALSFYYGRKAKVAAERAEKDLEKKKQGPSGWTPYVLAFLFLRWYANRTFLFPYLIRVAKGTKESFALYNAAIGAFFLMAHGFLNGRAFSLLNKHYTDAWLTDPRFLVGWALHEMGFWIVLHSENVMRNLRPADGIIRNPQDRYKIPMGGLYNYVTNAPYFGELLGWFGFAVLTWSPSMIPVFFISLSNLVPRSFVQHEWYLKRFGDAYPKDRKVLVPFLL